MATYNILIVEDDQMIAESLMHIIDAIDHKVAGLASSAEEALQKIEETNPDIALLDIQINGDIDGIELAEMIQKKHDLPFIFTTAYADDETIEKAKEQGPFGYLVKPYGIKEVNAAIEIAMNNFESFTKLKQESDSGTIENNHLYVRTDSRLVKVNDEDILYVEAKGDYVVFRTMDKSYIVHSTMKNVEVKLGSVKFLKVHRSYIVNLDKIVDIEDSSLVVGDKVIPISRSNREALMQRINLL